MSGIELDPRFTFDAFIVGPANRLAAAAARRVAEAPGTTYNPLIIYSGSGLGKTHLLSAIGHHVQRVHNVAVRYETLEHLMEEISEAVAAGERDAFHGRLRSTGVLLLDDVQFLAGQRQTQDELIRAWDALTARGGQVVLTSDRPPQEIDGLDERLLSRLSGGLIVDVGTPDYETRVAIARRKAGERGQSLGATVYQALARIAFTNVRELQGALNRLIAVQELEQRTVSADEVSRLLGAAAAERGTDEFGEFLSEISGTVGSVVEEADRQLADAIMAWEGEGFRTRRLEAALHGSTTAVQAREIIRRYEQDAVRLRQIEDELRALNPKAKELARLDLLRDPDRISDAEALMASIRERQTPPPAPPEVDLSPLEGESLARRAARAVLERPGGAYNPLYVMGPEGTGKSDLLAALGHALHSQGGLMVAYMRAGTFEAELIDALERNRLEVWRARFRQSQALVLDDMDQLAGTERAQEELFHLFEELHRAGRQLVFASRSAPQDLGLPDRLRSRLESGLVVELDPAGSEAAAYATRGAAPAGAGVPPVPSASEAEEADSPGASTLGAAPLRGLHWMLSREKVLWEWPYPGDWIEESLD